MLSPRRLKERLMRGSDSENDNNNNNNNNESDNRKSARPTLDFPSKTIHQAAKDSDIDALQQCLDFGVDIDQRSKQELDRWRTPVLVAAEFGDFKTFKWLIEYGAAWDLKDEYGFNVLQITALFSTKDKIAKIEYCLEIGLAFPDIAFKYACCGDLEAFVRRMHIKPSLVTFYEPGAAMTPDVVHSKKSYPRHGLTHYAAACGELEIVQWLRQKQIEYQIEVQPDDFITVTDPVLLLAARSGSVDVVEHCLSLYLKPSKSKKININAIDIFEDNDAYLTESLNAHDEDAKETATWHAEFALCSAVEAGHLHIVQYLLEHPELELSLISRTRFLSHVSSTGPYMPHLRSIFKKLNEARKAYSVQGIPIPTLIVLHSIATGHASILNWVVQKHQIDLKLFAKEKGDVFNPLSLAAYYGRLNIVESLVSDTKMLVERSQGDRTPLLDATMGGQLHVMQWLVEQPRVSLKDRDCVDDTATLLAARHGNLFELRWLVEIKGKSLREKNTFGETVLQVAADGDHLDVVRWLVEVKAVPIPLDFKIYKKPLSKLSNYTAYWLLLYQVLFTTKEKDNSIASMLDNNKLTSTSAVLKALLRFEKAYGQLVLKRGDIILQNSFRLTELLVTTLHTTLKFKPEAIVQSWIKLLTNSQQHELITRVISMGNRKTFIPIFKSRTIQRTLMLYTFRVVDFSRQTPTQTALDAVLAYQLTPHTVLRLQDCHFQDQEALDGLLLALGGRSVQANLLNLELKDCDLPDSFLEALLPVLSKMKKLKSCDLSGNQMGYKTFRAYVETLGKLPGFVRFSVRRNQINISHIDDFKNELIPLVDIDGELQQIDITGNYFNSGQANAELRAVLKGVITITALTIQEFIHSEFVSIKRPEKLFLLTIKLDGIERHVLLKDALVEKLRRLRDKLKLTSFSELYKLMKSGLEDALLYSSNSNLGGLHLYNHEEPMAVCKKLLKYHPTAPLKHCLERHSIFYSERVVSLKSALLPHLTLSRDSWTVFLMARKEKLKSEHAMIAWEGLRGYGQRVLRVAHLTTDKVTILGGGKLVVQFFEMSMEKLPSFLRGKFDIAPLTATKQQVKAMEAAIDKEIRDGVPGRYKMLITSGAASKEMQKQQAMNCLRWAVEKIEKNLHQKIPVASGYIPSFTVLNLLENSASEKTAQPQRKRSFTIEKKNSDGGGEKCCVM